jgi:DALR anticodon binding domain
MQSDKSLVVVQYPSLGQWLADRLSGAIATLELTNTTQPDVISLPLFSQSAHQFGTFASPLLLQFASRTPQSTPQILGAAILQQWASQPEAIRFSPKLWIHPNGWLYAHFGTDDLAQWLQRLTLETPTLDQTREPKAIESSISHEPVLFTLQYAHARCCSLLRLAQQEGLLEYGDNFVPGVHTNPFEHQGTALWQTDTGELYLRTSSEKAILQALMAFPQSLSPQKVIYRCPQSIDSFTESRLEWSLPYTHLHKQAEVWGALFSNFYRDCRLFGAVQTHEPKLTQARFALVYIVKKVLAFLLEDIFQVKAPMEL